MERAVCPVCGGEITQRQLEQIQKKLEVEIESRLQDRLESEKQQIKQEREAIQQERHRLQNDRAGLAQEVERQVQRHITEKEKEIADRATKDLQVKVQAQEQRLKVYEQRDAELDAMLFLVETPPGSPIVFS